MCWVLFLVFTAGTASYFRDEITLWMKPELHAAAATPVPAAQAIDHAVRMLEKEAAGAARWFITLPDERNQALNVVWIGQAEPGKKGRGKLERAQLNPATGERMAEVRETRGGEFIYRLHYDLHYMPAQWARWIIGFCASSHERWPFFGRKVKKSLKIRLCVITPLTMATNMNIAQKPMIQRAHCAGTVSYTHLTLPTTPYV